MTLFVPALLIALCERIKIKDLINEFHKGNKLTIFITSISWGVMNWGK